MGGCVRLLGLLLVLHHLDVMGGLLLDGFGHHLGVMGRLGTHGLQEVKQLRQAVKAVKAHSQTCAARQCVCLWVLAGRWRSRRQQW